MLQSNKLILPVWMLTTSLVFDSTNGYLQASFPMLPPQQLKYSSALAPSSSSTPIKVLPWRFHDDYFRPSRSILCVTSGQYNDEDLMDETPAAPKAESNNNNEAKGIPTAFLVQVGLGTALVFVVYTVANVAISGAMGMASSASHALGDEVGRELSQLSANLWALIVAVFAAIWEVLKVMVPFIGKGIVDAGKAAAPVVGEATSRFTEAATPYVNEAARAVNEAASPFVQEAARVMDESVVAPVKTAVDTNIMVPIQGAQTSVSSQISTIQSSVTSQIDSTLSDVGQSVTSTIQDATNQASASVKGVLDAQTAKIIAPIQDVASKVGPSVKDGVKPIQDALPF